MKKVLIATVTLLLSVVLVSNAQDDKKIHVKIIKDEDGNVTKIDTFFTAKDFKEINWHELKGMEGVDDSIFIKLGGDLNVMSIDEFKNLDKESAEDIWVTVDSDNDGDSVKIVKKIIIDQDGNKKVIKTKSKSYVMLSESDELDELVKSGDGKHKMIIYSDGDDADLKAYTIGSDKMIVVKSDSTKTIKWATKGDCNSEKIKIVKSDDGEGEMMFITTIDSDDDEIIKVDGKKKAIKVIVTEDNGETKVEMIDMDDLDVKSDGDVKIIKKKSEDGKMVIKCEAGDLKMSKADENKLKEFGIESKNDLDVKEMKIMYMLKDQKLKLEFKLADKGNVVVKLINQSGKTVFEDKVKKFSGDYSNEIDLSKIDGETLYIIITQGDKSKIEKFMKK